MATNYQVNINMDSETVALLNSNGYHLQAFKGVQSSPNTTPMLWAQFNPPFGATQVVSWQAQYGGYFSTTQIEPNAKILITTSSAMAAGDVYTMQTNGTTTLSTSGGVPGEMVLINNEQQVFTCGMTLSNAPICALPITGSGGIAYMEPYECVVLLFATQQVATGTVVEEAQTPSITVILSPSQPSVTVSYNKDGGWNTGGNPEAVVNPPMLNLASVLVIPVASASEKRALKSRK